jgi:hypothetical protein
MALPTAAGAATQVGNTCTANEAVPGLSAVQLSGGSGGLPIAVPQAGVITSWSTTVVPFPGSITQQLKVFRPTANPVQFQVAGESESVSVVGGANTFATRIAVQPGDRVGLGPGESATGGALFCAPIGGAQDVFGYVSSPAPLGSTLTFTPEREIAVAASAMVEPDADHDGYGDETQDGCPQSAAFSTPCPPITIDAFSLPAKGAVTIVVSVSSAAPVTVAGTVKAGKGKPLKLKAPPRTLQPGTLNRFKLTFPAKLKSALGEIPPSHSLQLKVTAQATSPAGAISADHVKAKLKGQG